MKEQIIIELTIKDRRGQHLVTIDKIKGLSPNLAIKIIDHKYATNKKNNSKKLKKLLRK